MTETPQALSLMLPRLQDAVSNATVSTLAELNAQLGKTPHLAIFEENAAQQILGGKRFRGLFALLGAHFIGTSFDSPHAPTHIAAALEFYQASALAHDDVIDNALTRRGAPTPHIRFADHHRKYGLHGDAQIFGQSSAILLGDYLLSCAELAFGKDCVHLTTEQAISLRERFSSMHASVALGQFLDIAAEVQPLPDDTDATAPSASSELDSAIATAIEVVTRKSARYSVVEPFIIGAQFAGATENELTALEEILLPWGIAFQLHDDELGACGDSTNTGKPVGDDLREGKRTVLFALTWHAAKEDERRILRQALGNMQAPAELITQASEIVKTRGLAPHRDMIAQFIEQGHAARARHHLHGDQQMPWLLDGIADILINRQS